MLNAHISKGRMGGLSQTEALLSKLIEQVKQDEFQVGQIQLRISTPHKEIIFYRKWPPIAQSEPTSFDFHVLFAPAPHLGPWA